MNLNELKRSIPKMPNDFSEHVDTMLYSLPPKKEQKFKRILVKRVIPVLATVLALTSVAFAAGKIASYTSHGSNIPSFTSVPSDSELSGKIGFNPNIPASLPGGYTFKSGHINESSAQDESGKTVWKGKDLMVRYQRGQNKLNLNTDNPKMPRTWPQGEVSESYNGISLYYSKDSYKYFPPGYELTEQDKADEASGKYVFGYGTSSVEINIMQNVAWEQDGIPYQLLGIDSPEGEKSLIEMAKFIIDNHR